MKLLALPLAILVGVLAHPILAPLAVAMPYLLMLILLLTFLRLRLEHLRLRREHWILFAAQLVLCFTVYYAIRPFDDTLAVAGFMICITPTAASAPALVGMLRGNVEFVTVASVLGNIFMAAILPVLLTLLGIHQQRVDLHVFGLMLMRTLGIVLVPLFVALVMRKLLPVVAAAMVKRASLSFYIWTITLATVCARSADYLRQNPQPPRLLVSMAILSAVLCALHFTLGRRIGGRELAVEAGQALGQRNTLFTIWASMALLHSPLIALGPTFYIIWHNVVNSYQLWRAHAASASPAVDA